MMSAFRRLCILIAACLLFICSSAIAEAISHNPLLDPQEPLPYAQTEDEFVNILLLGIDYGGETWHTSGGKQTLEECHTDGVVVVSLNMTENTVSLVSIPRDSLTYVPGVRGIYKFNGAINCAPSLEEGIARACKAASWHLGGIPIDKYVAVDAKALTANTISVCSIWTAKVFWITCTPARMPRRTPTISGARAASAKCFRPYSPRSKASLLW